MSGHINQVGEDFHAARARLGALMDTDAPAAVSEARRLPDDNNNWKLLRASILCDAGAAAGDLAAVQESAAIFARLNEVKPGDGELAYYLANAFVSRAKLELKRIPTPDWYLATAGLRHDARSRFAAAAKALERTDAELASRALTNLGNSRSSRVRVMARRATATTHDRGPSSGCSGCGSLVRAG